MTVPISEHAADRWDQRTDPASVSPETAWKQGQRVVAAEQPCSADEVRYHRGTDTLLLRTGPSIVTVLDVTADELRPAIQDALQPLLTNRGSA